VACVFGPHCITISITLNANRTVHPSRCDPSLLSVLAIQADHADPVLAAVPHPTSMSSGRRLFRLQRSGSQAHTTPPLSRNSTRLPRSQFSGPQAVSSGISSSHDPSSLARRCRRSLHGFDDEEEEDGCFSSWRRAAVECSRPATRTHTSHILICSAHTLYTPASAEWH